MAQRSATIIGFASGRCRALFEPEGHARPDALTLLTGVSSAFAIDVGELAIPSSSFPFRLPTFVSGCQIG